ncbi:MAG: 50S ribosomal protein L3, partial [Spirochaetales bacterium]|nr:50S ribosomal protein L3 [Spirochaetales bacterium]
LIGKKIGMTQVFDDGGNLVPVTVIKVEKNVVVGTRTAEKDGYNACVMGSIDKKKSRVTKPYAGQFPEGVDPKRHLLEIRDFEKEYSVGDSFGVELFEGISFVDVIGTSKGKGYQGAMKRHNFKGGRATHGSKFHRDLGGTSAGTYPGKVFKGNKMAGRMGGERKTIQNLQIISIDSENQLLAILGAVPGTKSSMVFVRKAKKR